MNLLDHCLVGSGGDDTRGGSGVGVQSIKGRGKECRAEGGSVSFRTGVSSSHVVEWMVGLKGPS